MISDWAGCLLLDLTRSTGTICVICEICGNITRFDRLPQQSRWQALFHPAQPAFGGPPHARAGERDAIEQGAGNAFALAERVKRNAVRIAVGGDNLHFIPAPAILYHAPENFQQLVAG